MKIVRMWGPVILWMGIIYVLSTRQRIEVSPTDLVNFLFFKTLHVAEYAVLFFLYYRVTKSPVLSFLFTILYAMTDEIHQLFVPTREGRVRDVIIDTAGAVLAWISITTLLPKSPKKLQRWVGHWLTI